MSHFWAKFKQIDNNVFRLNTRIYLQAISTPMKDDKCIGGEC